LGPLFPILLLFQRSSLLAKCSDCNNCVTENLESDEVPALICNRRESVRIGAVINRGKVVVVSS